MGRRVRIFWLFVVVATVTLWAVTDAGPWSLTLPLALVFSSWRYRPKKKTGEMQLFPVQIDHEHTYFVFAHHGPEALELLACARGYENSREWWETMVCEYHAEEVQILAPLSNHASFATFTKEALHRPGLTRIEEGQQIEMPVHRWAKYFPDGGVVAEVEW